MRISTYSIAACLCAFFCSSVSAQTTSQAADGVAKSTEFAIPAAPAFVLLNATPDAVIQPTTLRNFKIDWSLKSYRLAPNIALEAQPIWFLMYERADLKKYRESSPLMQTLSTLDLSVGTIQTDNGENRLSIAAKLNLYRENDPLKDKALIGKVVTDLDRERKAKEAVIAQMRKDLSGLKEKEEIEAARKNIESAEDDLDHVGRDKRDRLDRIRAKYLEEHWNSSMIDVAAGKIFNYQRQSLDSLQLSSSGWGVWVNGGLRAGKHGLVTGLLRYTKNAELNNFLGGANVRYGSDKYNFFVESVYDLTTGKAFAAGSTTDLVAIDPRPRITFAYGGNFRVGKSVLINFAIRTEYNKDLRFSNFIPIASINCLMR